MALLRTALRMVTLITLAWLSASELRSEEPTGAQVLFSFDRKEAVAEEKTAAQTAPIVAVPLAELPPVPVDKGMAQVDPAVVAASHAESAAEPTQDRRRLAPLSRTDLLPRSSSESELNKLPFEIPHVDSLGTAGAGLVLVVGLFLLCVSLMRRGGPSPTTPLPHDAVAVLGRVPLTPKQFAHLIQVGNKLVLVSITGDRTDTITEITEPAEVERLLVMCLKGSKQSSSAEFQKLLAQMAKEPARGFLGREAASYNRSARG
jgi:flagellar biogenesis protein FliO